VLEGLVGAWLLRRVRFQNSLERLRDVLGLVILGALVSTSVSATIGVSTLCLGMNQVHPWKEFGSLWLVWWIGDAVGNLVIAPVLLPWASKRRVNWEPRRLAEAAALFAALIAICVLVFAGDWTRLGRNYPLAFTIFPFVIWAALRFGPPATTLATLVASGIAIWGTLHNTGEFASASESESLVLLQTFMGVVATTALVLAAATAERRKSGEAQQQSLNLLAAVTQGTTDAVFVKDLEGRYLLINSAGAGFLGRTVEEILGKDDREFFSLDTAKEIMERDQRIMASGETQTYEE